MCSGIDGVTDFGKVFLRIRESIKTIPIRFLLCRVRNEAIYTAGFM